MVRKLLAFLICAGLMGWAFWLQYVEGLEPCPLCMFQRVAMVATGVIFLIGALHNPGRVGAAVYAVMTLITAGIGAALAAWQVWIQAQPKGSVAACGMGLNYMMETMPLLDVITKVLKENGLATIDVANFNSPSQTVVSGPVDDIRRAGPIFEKGGARMYMPLQVSAAFHSRYIAGAAQAFGDFLAPMSFSAPKTPVIANVTAQPYPAHNASESVKSLLVNQIAHSVQWTQSIRFLISQGVTQFSEMGPGNVLTRSVQQIQQEKDS